MKPTLYIHIILLFCCGVCLGQSELNSFQSRELGLRFSGFDDFNLMYKKQKSEDRYCRHRLLFGDLSLRSNNSEFNFDFGYAFGWEKRREIAKDLNFYSGVELALFSFFRNVDSGQQRLNSLRLVPSIGYVLGFMLEISDKFNLSIEVIPALSGNFFLREGSDNSYEIRASGNSSTTSLSLMYIFE